LDEAAIIRSARKTGCVVTAEEHQSMVDLAMRYRMCLQNIFPCRWNLSRERQFRESGKPEELLKKYGLDTPDIIAAAELVMSRKRSVMATM